MEKSDPNPFSVSATGPLERGVFADHATLRQRGFLFRVVEFDAPFIGRLTYSGWWFRQTIEIDGVSCWFQISWLKIHSEFQFTLPEAIALDPRWGDPSDRNVRVEISFSPTLGIRRFRIWLSGRILYDEIN